jgi:hypothetical protein
MNNYVKLLIVLNIILISLSTYIVINNVRSDVSITDKQNASPVAPDQMEREDEQARKQKINSALEKLTASSNKSNEAELRTDLVAENDSLQFGLTAGENSSDSALEIEEIPQVDQAQLDLYQSQADEYKKSLEAVASKRKSS